MRYLVRIREARLGGPVRLMVFLLHTRIAQYPNLHFSTILLGPCQTKDYGQIGRANAASSYLLQIHRYCES